MNIIDFFNPLDIDHLRAYQHLQKKGSWPLNFIPGDVEFNGQWFTELQTKMADFWVGTNIFMHEMIPSEKSDAIIDLDRMFKIADDFDKKRKKND